AVVGLPLVRFSWQPVGNLYVCGTAVEFLKRQDVAMADMRKLCQKFRSLLRPNDVGRCNQFAELGIACQRRRRRCQVTVNRAAYLQTIQRCWAGEEVRNPSAVVVEIAAIARPRNVAGASISEAYRVSQS